MKKLLITFACIILSIQPTYCMWRTLARLAKTQASIKPLFKKTITSIKPLKISMPSGLKNSRVQSFIPRWQTSTWPRARIMPIATTLTAATLIAWPYRGYAQPKEEKNEQSIPVPLLWNFFSQGKQLSRYEMTQSFIADCVAHEHKNSTIASHTFGDTTARLATYNVHMWKDAFGRKNFDAITDTIKKINADVLVLQEVHMFDHNHILNRLKDLGYQYTCAGQTTTIHGKFFGNMIVSKYPFAQEPTVKTYDADQKIAGERRCYIKATVQLPHDKKVTVYGTHLDVYDDSEALRTQEIEELVADAQKSTEPCVIGADYNAVRARDYNYQVNGNKVWDMLNHNSKKRIGIPTQTKALETLERNGFIDSFTKNNQQSPRFTVWSGTAVDFFYLNKNWNLPITNSYVYYSSASDHLPILMDVHIT